MNDLFNKMFGKDALSYEFDKGLKSGNITRLFTYLSI